VAALRLTKSKNDNQYTFLRSLCVSREHRRHGLATRLLKESLQAFCAQHCCCFASPELESFYQKVGFFVSESFFDSSSSSCSTDGIIRMFQPPKWMLHSFESMAKRNQHKELKLYIQHNNCTPPPPQSSSAMKFTTTKTTTSSCAKSNSTQIAQIVLLQHYSEQSKTTATGWLLDDTQYYKFEATIPNNTTMNKNDFFLVKDRMKVSIWTWRGTNDVALIEDQIRRLFQDENRTVYLLWTGGAEATAATTTSSSSEKSAETYIIIDGTWQQAKKIYRKVSILWSLPRISVHGKDVPHSKYVLRGDYSGWRDRFGTTNANEDEDGGNGSDLLCTAEVAAAVMDRCGDKECADVIRSRLDVFQSTFS